METWQLIFQFNIGTTTWDIVYNFRKYFFTKINSLRLEFSLLSVFAGMKSAETNASICEPPFLSFLSWFSTPIFLPQIFLPRSYYIQFLLLTPRLEFSLLRVFAGIKSAETNASFCESSRPSSVFETIEASTTSKLTPPGI